MKKLGFVGALIGFVGLHSAQAALLTDPNDPRTWQGATVGTFAQLYFGSDTPANRQLVIDRGLLDDGLFSTTGFTAAPVVQCAGCQATGRSFDTTGTGSFAYGDINAVSFTAAGSDVDAYWLQTGNVIGNAVWDLGAGATTAVIFNTIDHGPMPQEAIESTVYLSNDRVTWMAAVTERVWLEGFMANTGILWDGFAYAVGTGTNTSFRYASIIWGGPGGLIADGDNEINGVMGATRDFEPPPKETPEPGTLGLFGLAIAALGFVRRRR